MANIRNKKSRLIVRTIEQIRGRKHADEEIRWTILFFLLLFASVIFYILDAMSIIPNIVH